MPGLVIKDLPRELHRKLKERAARHHCSMTEEVLALLEQALGASAPRAKVSPPFNRRLRLTDKFLDKAKREGRA